MDAREPAVGERALAMLAVNKPAIFEVAESEADCNTADAKSAAELMFARDRESNLVVSTEYLFCESGDKPGAGGGQALGGH